MDARELINNAVAQVATDYGALYVKEIKAGLKQADKLASGALYNSIKSNVVIDGVGVHLQLLYNDYLQWINAGRLPGKMPPVDAIQAWVKERGINTANGATVRRMSATGRYAKASFKFNGRGKNGRFISIEKLQRQMAWAIAKGIEKKGIKPVPILDNAAAKVYGPMQNAAMKASVKIARQYFDETLAEAMKQHGIQIITTY